MGSISPLQIYQAIRNRGYTNVRPWRSRSRSVSVRRRVVRLRGLKEFETHAGGFCLYSREFHSPGQVCFYYCLLPNAQCPMPNAQSPIPKILNILLINRATIENRAAN
ncbi:hypothetical protein [Nostoc sp. NMS4]|uniref:hypothetical protein n=1 Tax=Nostoc sp. NMS4 TaxID=2815390 RepID=UPI0025D37DF1|nr:hypothetical protein [Nostoc sp. NMS4]MBN3925877.1 hypothetical protein [Nostoc sp. NMS4]